jgi:hypothetical protein
MENDCAEVNRTKDHCTEEFCAEDNCIEETCVEEPNEPEEVSFFICQMAFALLQGMVTEKDIYTGMLEANCNNKEVAEYITSRAVEEARIYRNSAA